MNLFTLKYFLKTNYSVWQRLCTGAPPN